MRLRVAAGLSLASALSGGTLVACFDLFHSTAGVLTACQLDAQACAEASATDAGPTDFCAWSYEVARQNATHACAWLGACESPLGDNAFGACMFQALLAYDCEANPNHPVRGAEHAAWDCLWQVKSCNEVDTCVFPGGVPTCGSPGDYTSCGNVGGQPANGDVRVECVDGGQAHGESCLLEGQTCAASGTVGVCAGSMAGDAGLACSTLECDGTRLHWCTDGGDVGIDCADNGRGACGGFPPSPHAWLACVAEGDAGCDAGLSAGCQGGYAFSCPSGVAESIDCLEILQVAGASCTPGTLSPPFDWTSPCRVSPAMCTADSCDAGTLVGCTRGAPFFLDCPSEGLGACRMVATDVGSQPHAACTPPPNP
jgi:hypothetical protein